MNLEINLYFEKKNLLKVPLEYFLIFSFLMSVPFGRLKALLEKASFDRNPTSLFGRKSNVPFRSLLGIKKIWQIPIFAGGDPKLSSALMCLTSVFGMGTGVTTSISSPEMFIYSGYALINININMCIMHIEKYI